MTNKNKTAGKTAKKTGHKTTQEIVNKINARESVVFVDKFEKWFKKQKDKPICSEIVLATVLCEKYNRYAKDNASIVFKGGEEDETE